MRRHGGRAARRYGGRAVGRYVRRVATFAVVLLTALPPNRLSAQAPRTPAPPTLHYGKWAAAALAVSFTGLGLRAHHEADDAFRNLVDYCLNAGCTLGTDGRYMDPGAEARYRDVQHGDRAARAWFIGGQAALAGAVLLFVLELRHDDREPRNIPYRRQSLLVEPGPFQSRFGVRLALP